MDGQPQHSNEWRVGGHYHLFIGKHRELFLSEYSPPPISQANQGPVRSSIIDYKVNLYILIFVKLASQNIYFFSITLGGKSLNNPQSLVLFGFKLTALFSKFLAQKSHEGSTK